METFLHILLHWIGISAGFLLGAAWVAYADADEYKDERR